VRDETAACSVEACEEGFLIVRKPGADGAFDEVARRAVNHAGEAFAAFPRADGRGGYESVLIVPIAT
jgi:hypothetical protein